MDGGKYNIFDDFEVIENEPFKTEIDPIEKQIDDNMAENEQELKEQQKETQILNDNLAKSANTLNKILAARSTSGTLTCSNYPSMSGMSALEKVKLQTRIEMWLEKGLEFNNNKRWGIAVDRTGSANHFSSVKTLSLDEMNIEIPVDELYTNPNWK